MSSIDLRSDTLTPPTPAMRKAMAAADVGDDVFGEDPTVNRLQELAAERTGKEAALFVASGTMANLVSLMTHCGRGDEIILGDQAHIFFYEQGGSAAVGGIHPRTVANRPDGTLDLEAVRAAIRFDDVHFPRTRLLVLENTHNRCNGTPIGPDFMAAAGKLAGENNLKIHVDGARIFNAACALGVCVADLVAAADSVSFCLSKGLASPVGSLVCGSRAFIARARRARKVLGGGMRQAGVLAAAGIISLTEMIDRLAEDHANAKRLATGLADLKGVNLDPNEVLTNIVYFQIDHETMDAAVLVEKLAAEGVKILPVDARRCRAVTHYPIRETDINHALYVFSKVLASKD
ncbi:MAG: low-specificity L-threonine aldolase [Desulfobacterales bacterium]|nr:low-specificity L-threonine aldolase [Desulfobacterales bacterium]